MSKQRKDLNYRKVDSPCEECETTKEEWDSCWESCNYFNNWLNKDKCHNCGHYILGQCCIDGVFRMDNTTFVQSTFICDGYVNYGAKGSITEKENNIIEKTGRSDNNE